MSTKVNLSALGPSGCGKTTLLRAIAGLDIQTSGSTEQEGRDISSLPPSERDFGIVFQSYALFPNLTVTRNVAYGLENINMKKDDVAGDGNVRLGGVNLSAGVSGMTDSADVTLCVRPEDVVARDIGAKSSNSLKVEIDDMEFLGSFYQVNLILTDGERVPLLADFSINLVRDHDLAQGNSLFVTLPESRIHVFPRS